MRIPHGLAMTLALALLSVPALAQQQAQPSQSDGPLAAFGRWFSDSFASLGSHFREAEQGVTNFRNEAGVAAKKTGTAVKDAADAVTKLPNTRVLAGHQKCTTSANGAPDCHDAADRLCRRRGFASGQTVDITSAHECPLRVTLGQREARPGECKNVTFVSRAMCQ
jgi:hypothetical protein